MSSFHRRKLISLDRSRPFVDAVRGVLANDERTVANAASLLHAAEKRFNVAFSGLLDATEVSNRIVDEDRWYEECLAPCIRELNLICSGDLMMNFYGVGDGEGRWLDWGMRGWASAMAEWANQSDPGTDERPERLERCGRRWHYMDFYMSSHVADAIRGYAPWEDKLRAVLDFKDQTVGRWWEVD